MRVCVTEHRDPPTPDLRPTGELAPSLALPWITKLRDGMLMGQVALVLITHYLFHIALPLKWIAIPLALTAAKQPRFAPAHVPFQRAVRLGIAFGV